MAGAQAFEPSFASNQRWSSWYTNLCPHGMPALQVVGLCAMLQHQSQIQFLVYSLGIVYLFSILTLFSPGRYPPRVIAMPSLFHDVINCAEGILCSVQLRTSPSLGLPTLVFSDSPVASAGPHSILVGGLCVQGKIHRWNYHSLQWG